MPALSELAANDSSVAERLRNLSISNRELGRQLGVDEKSIRRWRKNNLQSPYSISSPQPKYKNGVAQWVPGIDLGPDDGEVRTVPRFVGDGVDEPVDADLMRELGVDPDEWEIIARRESRWQQKDGGDFLKAYRISVRRRSRRTGDLSTESMNEILATYPAPYTDSRAKTHPDTLIVPVGDLQVGKSKELNGGTPELIERFAAMTEMVRERIMFEAGHVHRLILPYLGDCVEGIISQGGRLATRLDVSATEQVRIYRRLMLHQIATLAPYADHVIVPVVQGNHDETTRMFATDPTDSWAIEGASAVADALEMSEKYGHVKFLFPQDEELVITLNAGTDEKPFILAFTHGHLVGNPNKTLDWWKGQSHGRQHGGDADMLFSGHFHHLRVEATGGGRTWVQIPALDGGSSWFRRSTGADEPAGMVSMWITPGKGNGWEGLTCHR
jgi:hypothetical protein